jgi:hypothetical protein
LHRGVVAGSRAVDGDFGFVVACHDVEILTARRCMVRLSESVTV